MGKMNNSTFGPKGPRSDGSGVPCANQLCTPRAWGGQAMEQVLPPGPTVPTGLTTTFWRPSAASPWCTTWRAPWTSKTLSDHGQGTCPPPAPAPSAHTLGRGEGARGPGGLGWERVGSHGHSPASCTASTACCSAELSMRTTWWWWTRRAP